MNWEFANISVALNQPYPFLGIYMPINNPIFSRLIRHLRSRFGTILLKAGNVKMEMEGWEGKPYILGVAADQSPSNTLEAYWLNFMNQPSGFIKKPWTKVKALGHAAIYMKMKRVKRGYYRFEAVPIVDDVSKFSEQELVLRYRDLLEDDIYNNPDNYLWTHRRWKKKWKKEYRSLWIDKVPLPAAVEA
jgi:KDO2-lipid IV(A) lauroyltransferase